MRRHLAPISRRITISDLINRGLLHPIAQRPASRVQYCPNGCGLIMHRYDVQHGRTVAITRDFRQLSLPSSEDQRSRAGGKLTVKVQSSDLLAAPNISHHRAQPVWSAPRRCSSVMSPRRNTTVRAPSPSSPKPRTRAKTDGCRTRPRDRLPRPSPPLPHQPRARAQADVPRAMAASKPCSPTSSPCPPSPTQSSPPSPWQTGPSASWRRCTSLGKSTT